MLFRKMGLVGSNRENFVFSKTNSGKRRRMYRQLTSLVVITSMEVADLSEVSKVFSKVGSIQMGVNPKRTQQSSSL